MTRGIRVAAAVGLMVLLPGTVSACGDGSVEDLGSPSQGVARIRAILTDLHDLPAGFSDHPREAWRAPFRAKDRNCRVLLNAAAGRLAHEGPVVSAGASYQGDRLGEIAGLRLTHYSRGEAGRQLERISEAMSGCSSARSRHPGGRDRLKAMPLPMTGMGWVEATAMRGRVGGYPYELHLVFARHGHTLISLVHTGMAAPEARRTEEITRLLLAKVEKAL